jgi:hypothetical protein
MLYNEAPGFHSLRYIKFKLQRYTSETQRKHSTLAE